MFCNSSMNRRNIVTCISPKCVLASYTLNIERISMLRVIDLQEILHTSLVVAFILSLRSSILSSIRTMWNVVYAPLDLGTAFSQTHIERLILFQWMCGVGLHKESCIVVNRRYHYRYNYALYPSTKVNATTEKIHSGYRFLGMHFIGIGT